MAISPFSARPTSPDNERRRARLVLVIAMVGIAATLLAYAISPGVRRDVRHAAHSVGHALDKDKSGERRAVAKPSSPKSAAQGGGSKQSTAPKK